VFSGGALFYVAITRNRGPKSQLISVDLGFRLLKVRQLRQMLPSSFASVRRHLVDRTLVRRKIFKLTPKIFGET